MEVFSLQLSSDQFANGSFAVGDEILPNYMGVSKKGVTPKWMVYNGKPY